MIRICIVCEGATEVEFVRVCLIPHLFDHGINAYPSIIQAPSGRHRGGRVTVERLARFISHEYHRADRLTTLVDYYGFQGAEGRIVEDLEQEIIDNALNHSPSIDPRFLRPYIQMYEFEGLLFSDVEQFRHVLDGWDADVGQTLIDIRSQFPTPEDINNNRQTAPSKRILAAFPAGSYSKTEHGPVISSAIGVAKIRQQCPRFGRWITMLEQWGK